MVTADLLSVLGIDVSKTKFDAAVVLSCGIRTKEFSNSTEGFEKLLKWLRTLGVVRLHACMEATGRYYEKIAEFLYSGGYVVSVVNPARIKGFGNAELLRNKTDKIDAGLIARFCVSQNPTPWQPMLSEVREVQEVERYLGTLKAMKLQEKNRLGSGVRSSAVKKAIEKHIEQIDSEIAELEKWLKEHLKRHATLAKQVKLITSIPGIGLATAVVFIGEIGNVERFNFVGQIEAFAGLSTKRTQSGTSVKGQERLSKVGNSIIRKALYLPAIVAMKHNPFMKSFATRLLALGKKKMVIIGAVMRKLLRMIFAVVKSGKPFDRNYKPASMYSIAST
jgi:transposase